MPYQVQELLVSPAVEKIISADLLYSGVNDESDTEVYTRFLYTLPFYLPIYRPIKEKQSS